MTAPDVRRLRVLALVSKAPGISPGQRFRLEQWAPHLRSAHAIDLEFVPFESEALTEILYTPGRVPAKAAWVLLDFVRRAGHVARARGYDAVVMYREIALLGPAFYEWALRALSVPTLLDFDDAIWMLSGGGVNGAFQRLRFPEKTETIVGLVDGVTVGNAYLAEWARRRAKHVHVVPTSIDLASYTEAAELPLGEDDSFRIGWTGSLSTLQHLETARPVIERLAARRKVSLQIVCSEPPARPFAHAENVFVPWRAESEAIDVARCHAGIMPLPDDAFARGKCGCKALQFMAVSRPVVVSPVGVNADIVSHGRNGLHARTDDEWVEALDSLARDPSLRTRLAAEGRRTVEAGYSAEAAAAKFAVAVRDVVARRRAARPRSVRA